MSLGSEVRKTIYLFVFIGSLFRILAFAFTSFIPIRIISHVFFVFPEFCRTFVITMIEETTNLIFITGYDH